MRYEQGGEAVAVVVTVVARLGAGRKPHGSSSSSSLSSCDACRGCTHVKVVKYAHGWRRRLSKVQVIDDSFW